MPYSSKYAHPPKVKVRRKTRLLVQYWIAKNRDKLNEQKPTPRQLHDAIRDDLTEDSDGNPIERYPAVQTCADYAADLGVSLTKRQKKKRQPTAGQRAAAAFSLGALSERLETCTSHNKWTSRVFVALAYEIRDLQKHLNLPASKRLHEILGEKEPETGQGQLTWGIAAQEGTP